MLSALGSFPENVSLTNEVTSTVLEGSSTFSTFTVADHGFIYIFFCVNGDASQ